MSELFDTSNYTHSEKITSSFQIKGKKKPIKQKAIDPSWDEPELDWQVGDIAKVLDKDGRILSVVIKRIEKNSAVISFPDYAEQKVVSETVSLSKLIATAQTHWRREAWALAPILLEKFGVGSKWRSHELAQELNLPLGQVSQCLEKLEVEGKICHCVNWIYSLASEQDSCLRDLNSDSGSLAVPTTTNTVAISSENDSQEQRTTETLETSTGNECQSAISGQHRHHVNPSLSEESGEEDLMNETVSPLYLGESKSDDPELSASRTSPDYCRALTFQEANSSIFLGYSKGYLRSGTMQNGKLSPVPALERRGKEKDSSWLPTPTALSGGSGLMKLEIYLRRIGAIASNQVVNPILLEIGMGVPISWSNPRIHSTVLEFLREAPKLGTEEKHSETVSITESQSQPSEPASDSWNPNHFGEAKFRREDEQLTIFFDDSEEPPLPEDCKNLEEFEQKWKEWEIRFPQLSGKILEESETPDATKEPLILLEKESDRLSPHQEEFLEELRGSSCNTDTESSSEHHQILLEKIQEEIEENLDEDELYSHITAAEILEQEEWEKPYTAVPRSAKSYAKGQTGQLYSYGNRKKSKYGEPDSMYYWGYSYQVWDGFKWRSKSKSVPLSKLPRVREAIASRLGVEAVLAIL